MYDGDSVLNEISGTGTFQAEYVHGPNIDEVLSMERGGSTYYYHYDGLGSVTELTNASGTLQESYNYDAFGNPTVTSSVGNPYLFTGRRWDTESSIYHYRARQYDPTIGRFLQRDPLGTFDHMNLYAYTGNDPINFIDPYGLYSRYDFLRDASNFSAGFGDSITFGITDKIREWGGYNNVVDHCSDTYTAGGYTATGLEIAAGGAGIYKVLGKQTVKQGAKKAIAGKITGYTEHGLEQALGREGRGVAIDVILDTVKNPKKIIPQANDTIKYVGKKGGVVLNKAGEIVTTWGKARYK